MAIISTGSVTSNLLKLLSELKGLGITPSLYHATFVKPIDNGLLLEIGNNYEKILVVEENSIIGGLGSIVIQFINQAKLNVEFNNLAIPDEFIPHGSREQLLADIELDKNSLINTIQALWH